MTDDIDIYRLAKIAYMAYGVATGFLNYQALPMPIFDDLPDKIKEAWRRAALAVAAESEGR